MKPEFTSNAKNVAIQQVSFDSLSSRISEWSNRIAKRAYEFFADSGFTNGHDLEDWFKAEQDLFRKVDLEVKDAKNELLVKAEVPGFETKDFDIRLCGSRLIIEGKHETTSGSEHESRQIYQMIDLPAAVKADEAHADLKNGILNVKLPKAEDAVQIKIVAA